MEFILFLVLAAAAFLSILVLATILYATFVPVDVSLSYTRSHETQEFSWLVSWGIITVRTDPGNPHTVQVLLLNRPVYRFVRTGKKPDKENAGKRGESSLAESLYRGMSTILPFLTEIIPVVRRGVHLRSCTCYLAFGMDSPARTGCLYGWLSAARGLLYAIPRLEIHIVPVFDQPTFDLSFDAVFRITCPLLTGIRVYRILRRHFPTPYEAGAPPHQAERNGVPA
ncbi:MAG: DUF2953 domain-containing protein [Methanoregulaceae archaeon]